MKLPNIIAIDGPAASGKSTLALRLAQDIGYLFFDTGVMYRAITWVTIKNNVPIHNETAVTALAEETQIDVRPATLNDGRANDVLVNGQDVTWEIRDESVDAQVSIIAAYPGVRQSLTKQQRRVGHRGKIVMVGRDIGTVVLPEADLKIYLDASPEQRARRRCDELVSRGQDANYESILDSMLMRDHIDRNREVAPLRAAEDAVWLYSDHLNLDQVLKIAARWVHEGSGKKPLLNGKFDLLTIITDNISDMSDFYTQVMGFIPEIKQEGYVEFKHLGVRFAICSRSTFQKITLNDSYQIKPAGQAFELAFPVNSSDLVDDSYWELLARGAKPISPPTNMPWSQRTAFFADPDGNIHEIFAEIPS